MLLEMSNDPSQTPEMFDKMIEEMKHYNYIVQYQIL
jgi:hypothetical protein